MKAQYVPKDGLDQSGEWVWHFRLEAHNLSKVSLLRQLVVEAFAAGHWRSYATGVGRDTWRECEFDYFLIASDIAYRDAADVFTWKDQGRALAAATMSDDPRKRRPLEQASTAWHSPTPETLAQRAARLGWTSPAGVRSAAPPRARAFVRHGVTLEKHARQQRQRQLKERRVELDRVVERLVQQLTDEPALRYVVERLRERLAKARKKAGRPHGDHQQWAQDVATLKGNVKALAKHWKLGRSATYTRLLASSDKSSINRNGQVS
jgi:hypothetical protein